MKRARCAGLFVLWAVVVGPLSAHDTWLTPESGSVSPGAVVALDLTSGMAFPDFDHAIDPDRVDRGFCRLGGKTTEIVHGQKGKTSLRLGVRLDSVGIATLWVVLKPRVIELKSEEVAEYLEEIDASEALRKSWASTRGQNPWREVYTKHSKTFVRVGEVEADRSWAEPAGLALEIVPEKDPTVVRVGDEFPVRVLKRGAPLPGFPIGIIPAGSASAMVLRTDAQGRIAFRTDRAGWWLLRGTEIRRTSEGEPEWESDFTTLTIEVQAPQRGGNPKPVEE